MEAIILEREKLKEQLYKEIAVRDVAIDKVNRTRIHLAELNTSLKKLCKHNFRVECNGPNNDDYTRTCEICGYVM